MKIKSLSETLAPDKALAVYGKSFHWAKHFLGKHVGKNAAQLYQFCRVLDDMADGDIDDGPRRLSIVRKNLLAKGKVRDPIIVTHQNFLHKYQFSTDVIIALIDGLLSDQKSVRVTSEGQLLRYAYQVAGTVGILMCNVLDCKDERALDHAIDLGIAMQLTNIARDVLEDAKMGRRYLPKSWVGKLEPDQIISLAKTPSDAEASPITAAVKKILILSDTYYASGMVGLAYLPLRAHISISIAALVYQQIGVQLCKKNYPWHSGREITSSFTKVTCSLKALMNLSTRWHCIPAHDTELHRLIKGLPYVR